jgi:hypothetical protein
MGRRAAAASSSALSPLSLALPPTHACAPCHPFPPQIAVGRAEFHIKGLNSTQGHIFQGKKRFVHVAVQVRRAERGGGRPAGDHGVL